MQKIEIILEGPDEVKCAELILLMPPWDIIRYPR